MTGGELRGRRLKVPGSGVRPTADRVRESLFMILSSRLEGARALDLFAGSGALGIEALSRGAASATFVEASPEVGMVLRSNLATLGLEGRSRVWIGTAERWLAAGGLAADGPSVAEGVGLAEGVGMAGGAAFEVIFLDPPYGAPGMGAILAASARILAPGGIIVWEHDRRAGGEATRAAGLEPMDERRYGDTLVELLAPARGC